MITKEREREERGESDSKLERHITEKNRQKWWVDVH